ncbi:MAG: hypothetical protein LBH99_02300 [Rickettsia sp.]|jgi:tetratricopeptide (TPR) repeat protein|nr:hypothetical protein [Rickettsia sp.]
MPKFSHKQSSSNKTASLSRNSSLRSTSKGASNDTSTSTGTDPILEVKFKLAKDRLENFLRSISNDTSIGTDSILEANFKSAQVRLGALNQEYGDIQKIDTALNTTDYAKAQGNYGSLRDEVASSKLFFQKVPCPLEKEKENLVLFEIYNGLAISAFRAGKFKEHNKHLLQAYKKYSPAIDKSIIGLERWVEIYKTLGANAKDVPSISPQYDSLLKKVETEVQSLIKAGGYDQARIKMKYLDENSHNFTIFDLYFSTIKDPNEALKYFEDKSKKYNLTQRQDIHDILKKWQNHLINQVNDKEVAAKAATYASKYNPNPTVATAAVDPEVKKIEQKLKQAQNQVEKVSNKLETVKTLAKQKAETDEFTARQKVEADEFAARQKAEADELAARQKAEAEALKPKASPTKDTRVDEAGDFSPTSSLPPPYSTVDMSSHPYLKIVDQNVTTAPIAPVVKTVTSLDPKVLAELTKLFQLISSFNYYDSNYDHAKGRAKSLLDEVVKENPDVYKTIEDPKILVLLADVFLSSNKMEEARIVCKKALEFDPNIWQTTNDQIVLLNLAGVLLSSDQSKAKQVYSKAISIRIVCQDEHGDYKIDNHRTAIVSKTVAQNGYNDAERDCLVKVCLSSPKVYQQAQALNCYPHTDVAKREAIAVQLKQLAKHIPEAHPSGYKGYMLYSKAYAVLKDDQVLLQDMKAAYDTTRFATIMPAVHPYPPTEESTCHLLGMCANNDF